jgi:polysaccharide biosynthesis acetyltransferase WcbI-like protein
VVNATSARTRHFGGFYGVDGDRPDETRPLWLVVGNCQAEALRLVIDGVEDRPYATVRMPPVHELEPTDLPALRRLLRRTAVLLCQPIRAGYRDLPLGTDELAAELPASSRVVRWPVIRYAGLHPFQAIVRNPADRSVVPAVVPYHDLRTVIAARDGRRDGDAWDVEVPPEGFVAVAEASRAELAKREHLQCDVGISDVLPRLGADAAHTINHPGNAVLTELGRRILALLDVDAPVAGPGYTLLDSVVAPLERRVLDALGLTTPDRTGWTMNGKELTPSEVHGAQLRWYRDNPEFVPLALARHGRTLDLLGLGSTRAA